MDEKEKIKVKFSTAVLVVIIITLIGVIIALLVERRQILGTTDKIVQNEISKQEEKTPEIASASPSEAPSQSEAPSPSEKPSKSSNSLCHFNPEKGVNVDPNVKYGVIKTLNMYGEGISLNIILNSKNQVEIQVSKAYSENEPVASKDSIIKDMKRKLETTETMKGFSKKIDEIEIGTLGQDYTSSIILFLMEDGTVEYIGLMDLLKTDNLKSRGKIASLENIVRLESIDAYVENESGWLTTIAIDNNGNFYDLMDVLEEEGIDIEKIN